MTGSFPTEGNSLTRSLIPYGRESVRKFGIAPDSSFHTREKLELWRHALEVFVLGNDEIIPVRLCRSRTLTNLGIPRATRILTATYLLVVMCNAGENTIGRPFRMPLPAVWVTVRIERGTCINSSRRSLGETAH